MFRRSPLLVGFAAFVVYASLCPPVPGMGDSSEFDLVLATNGVAHPTGYPLYTLAGHAFCVLLHALGTPWPLGANLFSAVGAAVAIGCLHALGMELAAAVPGADDRSRALAALVPVALFAFQPILMGEAIAAEVNSWSLAWSCGTALAYVRLLASLAARTNPTRPLARPAAGWGLLCGIGLAHHLTSVLVSVPLSLGLLAALAWRRRLSPGPLAVAAGAALLPLAGDGIIAWRAWHPALVQWPALRPGLASVLAHVTGAQYRHFLGRFDPAPGEHDVIVRIAVPFLAAGTALLVLGLVRAREPVRRIAWSALLAAALLVTVFTFRYGVPDPAAYFLPAMALGAAAAAPALAALARPKRRGAALRLALAALAAVALAVPWIRAGAATAQEAVAAEDMIHSMWESLPSDSAIVLWPDDRFIRLEEYQLLRGEKPGLYVAMPDMLVDDATRPAFRARFGIDPLAGLPAPFAPGSAGRARASLNEVVENVNAHLRVPVIVFDPSVPVVRQLRKPWQRRASPAATGDSVKTEARTGR